MVENQSWSRVYAIVIIVLAVIASLMWIMLQQPFNSGLPEP